MSIDYICELTASISIPERGEFDISVSCPVLVGKCISRYDGIAVVKVPFIDAIKDKVSIYLRAWLPKPIGVSLSVRKLPANFPVTCDATAKSITDDIVKTLLLQSLWNKIV